MHHHSRESSLDEDRPATTVHELGTPYLKPPDCIVHHWLELGCSNLANAKRQTKVLAWKRGHLATQNITGHRHLLRRASNRVQGAFGKVGAQIRGRHLYLATRHKRIESP
jgi:hypothetical protein